MDYGKAIGYKQIFFILEIAMNEGFTEQKKRCNISDPKSIRF